jgi:PAS domain S-box-containing protein
MKEPKAYDKKAYSPCTDGVLAEIVEGTPIPCFVINKMHKVIHWNTAIEVLTGIRKYEIIGTDMQWKAFYPDKRPTLADLIVNGASGEVIESFYQGKSIKSALIEGAYEAEVFYPEMGDDGKWLNFTASPIKSGKGEIIGAIETLQDTTERKRIEELLLHVVEGSPIPAFVINKQHQVTHWNTAIEVLTGMKKQDIIGTDEQWKAFNIEKRPSMADFIVDGASDEVMKRYYKDWCQKSTLIDGAYEAEDFFSILGSSGKWLHFTASPIRNRSGEVIGAIETMHDITERIMAREALRESERNFRDLFESALDAIWVNDLDGNILLANKAATRLYGCSQEELCVSNINQLLTTESLNSTRDIQTKLVDGKPVDMPYKERLVKMDGTEVIVEMTTRLISQREGVVTFQNIARDVTIEQKMRDSIYYYLQKVMVAQEEERKRISRDLHDNTAQSLLLFIHKLDAEITDPKNRSSKHFKQKLLELNSMARDVLEDIRGYAQDLRPAILDHMGLISALEWMGDKLTAESGIEVVVQSKELKCQLPHEAELLLFRMAQEAFANIKRHSGASRVAVTLESENDRMRMIIIDNGKGFKVPALLGDLSNSDKLGLLGMQERAQLLGGTMKIQSEPGGGTTITIKIPVLA